MKTKLTSKTKPAASMASFINASFKKTCLLLLVLFSLSSGITKAQNTGTLVGIGMGSCTTYSFYSTVSQPTITPLNYSNQYYACTTLNDDDISFNPQGTGWRVEIKSWTFTYGSTNTGTLSGWDSSNSPQSNAFTGGDVLSTTNYTTVGGYLCCDFWINGSYVATYQRSNWTINAP